MQFIILLFCSIPLLINGQAIRPISFPAIVAILRYQNTPCTTDSNTPGTCLTQNDCASRMGTPDGTVSILIRFNYVN